MQRIKSIFIVDNDVNDLEVLQTVLKNNFDFNIHTFSDPREALETMSQISPDLILLDYYMPEMTGAQFMIEVSERLFQNPNWEVFLISGKVFSDEERLSMLTLGISNIFEKPLQHPFLIEGIKEYAEGLAQ